MKKLFTFLSVIFILSAQGQYFQRFYNVTPTPSTLNRDEIFNSGIHTTFNYDAPPDSTFLISVGTSYRQRISGAVTTTHDRFRYVKTTRDGSAVPINLAYEFGNTTLKSYHSSGNSVAEIKNATGNGGFFAVGAVSSNYRTGATLSGGSDALIARFNSLGTVSLSLALNFPNGADTAWCVRRSNFINNTFLVCGHSVDTVSKNVSCFVARVTSAGAVTWAFTYNFDFTSTPLSAISTARQLCEDKTTGNIYVVGTHQDRVTGVPNVDGLIFALNPGGGMIWSNTYHMSSDDEFKAVRLTYDRNLIVGGHTDFAPAGLAPMTNMLLLKVRAASGAIMFQSIHRVTLATGTQYDSKCFDVLERKFVNTTGGTGYEYYMAGPAFIPTGNRQLMYRVKSTGVGINSYLYNIMRIDSLFALDIDSTPSSRGIFMFSSLNFPGGNSSSHVLKTTYQGATCIDDCVPNPPKTIPIQMIVQQIPPFINNNYSIMSVTRKKYIYKTDLMCTQAALNCNNPRELPTVAPITKKSGITVYPNPAKDEITINTQKGIGNVVLVQLRNTFGQQVWQGKINGIGKINMQKFAPGVYFVHTDDTGGGYVSKVVKQ